MSDQDEIAVSPQTIPGNKRIRAYFERKSKKKEALRIVRRYMFLSGGIGLIPLPLVDQIMLSGLLAKMLHELFRLYGTKLSEHKAKAIIAAVLGGAHSDWIPRYLLTYVDKLMPKATGVAQIVIRPAIAVAITYSVGLLFVHHFDKGAWVNKGLADKPRLGLEFGEK